MPRTRPWSSLLSPLTWRYALAAIGPAGSSGAQFLLNLVLLSQVPAAAFGRFTFLLIVAQFAAAIWSALFCAPLPALLADLREDERAGVIDRLFLINLIGAALAGALLLVTAHLVGETWAAGSVFALYAALALVRWFRRAQAYVVARPLRSTASDLGYCVMLLGGTVLLWTDGRATTEGAYWLLTASVIVGLLPFVRFGEAGSREHTHTRTRLTAFWRQHVRWSLFGVVATEATTNAHAYLVTSFLGAGAFAPLAAGALPVRPVNVLGNALCESERARFAALADEHAPDALRHGLRHFRTVLLLGWFATAAATVALFALRPSLLYPRNYHLPEVAVAAALWMGTALIRLLFTPGATLLQAIGEFRALAMMSCRASVVTLAATGALVVLAPPAWSIVGVLIGETMILVLIERRARAALADADRLHAATPPAPGTESIWQA
ncbi:lipopolysaccharide biosynthesis protein [Sphingomonas sp.]|uniref:lipopolysaccharide biosynthesis protein n=1 Tax=Sphingomonas sp. TaxID=28214 RepID=UPI0035C80FDA